MSRDHTSDYDSATTALCEQALVTLLGDLGHWRERVYLVGGLAPRYIIGKLPDGASPHIGTTDVDLIIGLAMGDETPETYRTLETNLKHAGYSSEKSFRWTQMVDGMKVQVEFLCETDAVEPGRIFKPKGESVGSGLGAFNVHGASLVMIDFQEHDVVAERLDGGGLSQVSVRVCGLLTYTVLKIFAFQDRHDNKDAYDLLFCLSNADEGPEVTGTNAATNPAARDPVVTEALQLLGERFETIYHDGPTAYASFLEDPADKDVFDQRRREAVAVVAAFLGAFGRVKAP